MKRYYITLLLLSILFLNSSGQEVKLYSPDRNIEVRVNTSPILTWTVYYKNKQVLERSKIALQINDGFLLGVNQSLVKRTPINIQQNLEPLMPTKFALQRMHYSGMVFTFRINNLRDYQIEFRVFNSGVAYRFVTNFENEVNVENETVYLKFPYGTTAYLAKEKSTFSFNETVYSKVMLDTMPKGQLTSLPILLETNGVKLIYTEAALQDYPNMYLSIYKKGALLASLPRIVDETRPDPKNFDRSELMVKLKYQIALTYGRRALPWRVLMVSDKDAGLIENNLIIALSKEGKYMETEWIKPGTMVWKGYYDGLTKKEKSGKAGIQSTETYKTYIDFAAKYGFEYVLLEEGWSLSTLDVTIPNNTINIPALVEYAKAKNVGLFLWLLWKPLDEELNKTLQTYKKWGVKGIWVDYMKRNDQYMVNFQYRVAQEAFNSQLLVGFSTSFKPTGVNRAYPNVVSFGAVSGNKYNRIDNRISLEHSLQLPFIRMANGPLNYAPGAMLNVSPSLFKPSIDEPTSMGTRCRQLALFITYESPVQLLCDGPKAYEKDPDIATFLGRIPTTWDETKVLHAVFGKSLVIARRKGKTWYVAALTGSLEKNFNLPLSFLDPGLYQARIMEDGEDAQTDLQSYSYETKEGVAPFHSIKIHLAPGGGWAAIFEPSNTKTKKKKKKK